MALMFIVFSRENDIKSSLAHYSKSKLLTEKLSNRRNLKYLYKTFQVILSAFLEFADLGNFTIMTVWWKAECSVTNFP